MVGMPWPAKDLRPDQKKRKTMREASNHRLVVLPFFRFQFPNETSDQPASDRALNRRKLPEGSQPSAEEREREG